MELNELQGYLVALMERAVVEDHRCERGEIDIIGYMSRIHRMADAAAQEIASRLLD